MAEKRDWNVVLSGGGKQKRTLGPFTHRQARSTALENAKLLDRDVVLVRKSDKHTINPRFPALERRSRA